MLQGRRASLAHTERLKDTLKETVAWFKGHPKK
jgi:hypothetical protein